MSMIDLAVNGLVLLLIGLAASIIIAVTSWLVIRIHRLWTVGSFWTDEEWRSF